MAEPTYRIKPFIWEQERASPNARFIADTVFGMARVRDRTASPKWSWAVGHCGDEYNFRCYSLEEAQAAAETHCRERLMVALEVVDE